MAVVVGMPTENGSKVHPFFLPKDRQQSLHASASFGLQCADTDVYRIEQDPPRVKRRKSSSPSVLKRPHEPIDQNDTWIDQLEAAAKQGVGDANQPMIDYSPAQWSATQGQERQRPESPSSPVLAANIDGRNFDGAEDGHLDGESSRADQSLDSHTPLPARRMLRVRSDGKLSSPKKAAVKEEAVRRGRKSKAPVETVRPGYVVIKYGKRKKARIAIAKKIEAILSAPSPTYQAADPGIGQTKNQEPPKPPHPFFTGQLLLLQGPTNSKDKTETPSKTVHPFFTGEPLKALDEASCTLADKHEVNEPSDTSVFSKPMHLREQRVNSKPCRPGNDKKETSKLNIPTFGIDHARLMRVPGAREPMWPPKDMVHVGRDAYSEASPKSQDASLSECRKSKHVPIAISAQDNVVRHPVSGSEKVIQRYPIRHVMPGSKLQDRVRSQLSHDLGSSERANEIDELGVLQSGKPGSPPCLQHLYQTIESGRSAFDKFQCESQDWVHKYAPSCAEHVIQHGQDALSIRDWLKSLTVSSTSIRAPSVISAKPRKVLKRKRRRQDDLDDFIEASDDEMADMMEIGDCVEDEFDDPFGPRRTMLRPVKAEDSDQGGRPAHAAVVSGPHGCGKSAAIHAIAKELGFEVFEINAGSRRSGKDIIDRVGDMAHNHLVRHDHNAQVDVDAIEVDDGRHEEKLQEDLTSGRQTTMGSFFKTKGRPKKMSSPEKEKKRLQAIEPVLPPKEIKSQKQSLILLDEVDVLFEEDKPFWATILELIQKSRRPVIVTCTDESLLPLEDMLCYGIFRFAPAPKDLAVDLLLLIAANEGHLLQRDAVDALFHAKQSDLRASIAELQYYCQMAIGDRKGGLDWMLLDPLPENARVYSKSHLRVVSEGAYKKHLGWFGADCSTEGETEAIRNIVDLLGVAHHEWSLDADDLIFDLASSADIAGALPGGTTKLEQLQTLWRCVEACSVADLFPNAELRDTKDEPLDQTKWKMSPRYCANFIEGQRLLKGRIHEDLTGLTPSLALTLRTLGLRSFHEDDAHLVQNVRKTIHQAVQTAPRKSTTIQPTHTEKFMDLAFTPLTCSSTGASISSFDSPISTIATDLAPYVRSIVASDLRLEEQRQQLSATLEQPGARSGKKRKTRASYAALEGGSKASTRKERWFPRETNYKWVLRTGGKGWQDGVVAAMVERDDEMGVQGSGEVGSGASTQVDSGVDELS